MTADPSARAFVLTHAVAAPRELVWRAWTDADHLMQWFGPRGFAMEVAALDLRPGGALHYNLRSAQGQTMWGKWVFSEIVPPERLAYVSSFSDEAGGLARHPGLPGWPIEVTGLLTLTESGGQTIMTLRSEPVNATPAEEEMFVSSREMMHGGWAGTLRQLEEHLLGQIKAADL